MLDRLAPLAHFLRMGVEPRLNVFKKMFVLPAGDAALLGRRALIPDGARLAGIGPVAAQGQTVLNIGAMEGSVTLTVAGQTFGRRMPRSCRCGRIPPLLHRLGAELSERAAGDQMALRVEGVVDGGVGGQKSLR